MIDLFHIKSEFDYFCSIINIKSSLFRFNSWLHDNDVITIFMENLKIKFIFNFYFVFCLFIKKTNEVQWWPYIQTSGNHTHRADYRFHHVCNCQLISSSQLINTTSWLLSRRYITTWTDTKVWVDFLKLNVLFWRHSNVLTSQQKHFKHSLSHV